MGTPYLILERLRITWRGRAVYDERFHEGVNIIRGDNGSGKSTIADFIFYILGGQYEDWKDEAKRCDEVQAVVRTPSGHITLKRKIGKKTEPVNVFFGPYDKANAHALDGWETFPIKRTASGGESFSQVMFRSLSIPEAQSEGASNITMHQILRACYSDQRTPASRFFRFESWDTQTIRDAVGDLICGVHGYGLYEVELELRELEQEYSKVFQEHSALLQVLPTEEQFNSPESIASEVHSLGTERTRLLSEIDQVDHAIDAGTVNEFTKERRAANELIQKAKNDIEHHEEQVREIKYEIREISAFQEFLVDLLAKLAGAENMQEALGAIDFAHCPACGAKLAESADAHQCVLCKEVIDEDASRSKYNHIRLDIEIQSRETKQLLRQKSDELENHKRKLRDLHRVYQTALSQYEMKFSGGNGPREAFLAKRLSRVGYIDSEIAFLLRNEEVAKRVKDLADRKDKLNGDISKLRDKRTKLQNASGRRRSIALAEISQIGAQLLREDIPTQEKFENAKDLTISFRDDAISVDGQMNFAESSNVYLKNSAVLATFLASGFDKNFFHPRFLLMDNIEDKGMQEKRSRNAQKVLVEHVTEISIPHQVIYTTSMMNPELELEDYVVGPAYTKDHKTLNFENP